jgi:predicted enzyme related to lactoylglutathione lyase
MTNRSYFLKFLFLSIVICFICIEQTTSEPTTISKRGQPMKRVIGIGGIFFRASNPDSLRAWYRQHLGIEVEAWGGFAFKWRTDQNPGGSGTTVWNIFNTDTKYFNPSQSTFMINYRVDNLDELLRILRAEGCNVDSKVEESEFGKFGWVMDPEGNRIELWQPPLGQ